MSATRRLLVLGGNGYVGQNICNAAAASGKFIVQSLSRYGRPLRPNPELSGLWQVGWLEEDIFDASRRDEVFDTLFLKNNNLVFIFNSNSLVVEL